MPSIPQSLLWISLVVLWLFVLVPMLISKRDAVRRTSDVALATRVLNGGAASRLLRRRVPPRDIAATPTGSPRRPTSMTLTRSNIRRRGARRRRADPRTRSSMEFAVRRADRARLSRRRCRSKIRGRCRREPAHSPRPSRSAEDRKRLIREPHETERDDEYEYIEDSSGLEPDEDDDDLDDGAAPPVAPAASRRRRFDRRPPPRSAPASTRSASAC